MKVLTLMVISIAATALGLVIAGQAGFLAGEPPQGLGVKDGRLSAPSQTPNSVSSQADLYPDHLQKDYANIRPLAFSGNADAAMSKLLQLLQKTERVVVVKHTSNYIYVQFSTAILQFTDDVEFMLDTNQQVIHLRSASRIGRNDFGVNRARMESIRARFAN